MVLWEFDSGTIDKQTARDFLESLDAGEWVNAPSKALIDKIFDADVPATQTKDEQLSVCDAADAEVETTGAVTKPRNEQPFYKNIKNRHR